MVRVKARARAWAAGAAPDEIVIDIDGTLLDAHSDKQDATPTYKRGFGFYPIVAYLDATGEALAGLLRPGRAGSNNAADHLAVLDARAGPAARVDADEIEMLVRTDTAGATHDFIDGCVERDVRVLGRAARRRRRARRLHAGARRRLDPGGRRPTAPSVTAPGWSSSPTSSTTTGVTGCG